MHSCTLPTHPLAASVVKCLAHLCMPIETLGPVFVHSAGDVQVVACIEGQGAVLGEGTKGMVRRTMTGPREAKCA
jgi:hypothetical protein